MTDPFVDRLRREIESWVADGTITSDQGRRLAARYPEGSGAPSRFVAILSLVGATLVAAGIGLVIAHNWERINDGVKVAGLVFIMTGLYAAAFELRARSLSKTGEALLMAAGALFLCGIALVGQIYHLNARPPNAVLLWVAAILPVAYLLRAAPLFFLGAAGAVVWLGMEAVRPDSILYFARGRHDDMALQLLAPAVGALYIALGGLHAPREDGLTGFRRILESLGIVLFLGGIFLLSFQDHDWIGFTREAAGAAPVPLYLFTAIAAATIALVWGRWPFPLSRRSLAAGLLAAGLIAAILSYHGVPDPSLAGRPRTLLAWGCWAFGLAASLLFISIGLHWRRPGWINLGLLFVGLNIVTRYFDTFGSRLQQGVNFLLGGLLFLALGIGLERQRRRLLRRAAMGGAE